MHRLTSLKSHPGFKELMQIAEVQAREREKTIILTPLKGMDDTLEQEYRKGEVAGIMLFMEMTNIRIASLQEEINTGLAQLKVESNYEPETDVDD